MPVWAGHSTSTPTLVIVCHCTECQKLSTGPFSTTAVVAVDKIEFSGTLKEWERIAESSRRNWAVFYPESGNRMYHFHPDHPSTIKLKLKTIYLDDASLFEPHAHIWISEKVNWYKIPEGVRTFPKQFIADSSKA
ncbi:GFA family protein [Celerinatantimonas yamalensis]|uniref:GFA family protein n=1 Tax=Celerinatantimonas yamalensis TaxID=559956 RepID=UPI0038CC1C65